MYFCPATRNGADGLVVDQLSGQLTVTWFCLVGWLIDGDGDSPQPVPIGGGDSVGHGRTGGAE